MPIYIGYLFLGLACGILGQQAHIAPVEAFIMSILAYSGSGQFICIAMLMDNASLFSILVTNFMVSLRYMFFSTAMYPHIKDCSLPYSVIFAQNITDETFAVNLDSFSKDKDWDPQQGLALGFSPAWSGPAPTLSAVRRQPGLILQRNWFPIFWLPCS